jgi:hypothetical protein
MHEEVRDVDVLAGAAQALLVGDVAAADLAAQALQLTRARGIARQAADRRAAADQRLGEPASDETGGSRDQRSRGYRSLPQGCGVEPFWRSARSAPVVVVITPAAPPPSTRRTSDGASTRSAAAIPYGRGT